MKKSFRCFVTFFLFLCIESVFAQKPIMVCEKSTYNFGIIEEKKGPVAHVFVVKNMGKSPLIISKVDTSCGCTTPQWTKSPILAGKVGEIVVTYDPSGHKGVFMKSIKVYSNANQKGINLYIRGEVK